jgi:hypothetical protein
MRRRDLIRGFGSAGLLTFVAPVAGVRARPIFGDEDRPLPPRLPISEDNPRVWPASVRNGPLPLGAVDAFRVPDRATEMGVQWQRIMFDWSAIQRSGPDEWSFGWSGEDTARRERQAGRPVIGQFISTPSWASGTSDPKSPPLGLDKPIDDPGNLWATWVRSVAGRFAGLVDTWVMWNEPDVWSDENHARQWVGSIEQYYRLLQVGYLAAKSANPNATVLMAGMTYWWDAAYGREQYFERLLRLMARDRTAQANNWYFDAAVLQLYNNPRGLFDGPRIFRELMRRFSIDKPVWVNETNVVPWDDEVAPLTRAHFRATQDEQASFLVQAIAYAHASGVQRVAVYKMLDDSGILKGVEQAFGMVRDDAANSVRPVFRTFQMLRRELTESYRAQLVDEGFVNRVYIEQPTLKRRLTALWNTGPQDKTVRVAALGATAEAMDKFGAVRPLEVGSDGHIQVTLARATANTIPNSPETYFIGGEPVLVLEPLTEGYRPFRPTFANLPPAGQP